MQQRRLKASVAIALLGLNAWMGVAAIAASSSPATAVATTEPILCPVKEDAEQGSMPDQFYLGKAYDEGYCGLNTDKILAENWYRKAARQGHMLAQYELGETYFTGDGFKTDYPQAKQWYEQAARQGHGLSQLRLGFLNAEAHFEGLTTDYAMAEEWFQKAADQDAGDARFRLGNFYIHYKQPPDLGKGFIWLKRAAEGGHRVAMFDLARLLFDGRGVARNPVAALEWMQKSANADVLQAQMSLVEIYSEGRYGIAKDPRAALKWMLKIAQKPTASPIYLNKVADVFMNGWEGIQKNYPTARKYYERAAEKGDAHAKKQLAKIYEEGLGVEKDAAKAAMYRR